MDDLEFLYLDQVLDYKQGAHVSFYKQPYSGQECELACSIRLTWLHLDPLSCRYWVSWNHFGLLACLHGWNLWNMPQEMFREQRKCPIEEGTTLREWILATKNENKLRAR